MSTIWHGEREGSQLYIPSLDVANVLSLTHSLLPTRDREWHTAYEDRDKEQTLRICRHS
jgi:hypothetical protein